MHANEIALKPRPDVARIRRHHVTPMCWTRCPAASKPGVSSCVASQLRANATHWCALATLFALRNSSDHAWALSALEQAEPMLRQKDESSRVVNVLRSLSICKSVLGRHRLALSSLEEAADWTLEHGSGADLVGRRPETYGQHRVDPWQRSRRRHGPAHAGRPAPVSGQAARTQSGCRRLSQAERAERAERAVPSHAPAISTPPGLPSHARI